MLTAQLHVQMDQKTQEIARFQRALKSMEVRDPLVTVMSACCTSDNNLYMLHAALQY